MEDLSLSEIAINNKVSKASVSKTLRQVENKLNNYEDLLKIFSFKKELRNILELEDIKKIKREINKLI